MKAITGDSVLSVADINVDIGPAKILQHVSFSTCNGDLLAVMGPTGSGKTTLLNAIAGRQPLSAGNIYLSGQKFNKRLRRQLGFVVQQDVFFSNLTLWETLYFTAMIGLPESLPKADKLKRLENIIDLLQLGKCKNTVIGGTFLKGLSGGEKKRTSIARTLLTDPNILLLDEPTSGLDSSMTLQMVRQLKTLASENNKNIIVTIHQPSSQVYHMFDSLLLLSQGKVVYNGGAHREPLIFLERSGYKCDPLYNPADFMMDILSLDDPEIDKLVKSRELLEKDNANRNTTNSIHEDGQSMISTTKRYSSSSVVSIKTYDSDFSVSEKEKWPTGFAMQFRMLTWRSFKQSRRTLLHVYSLIEYTLLGVLAGVLLLDEFKIFRDIRGVVFYMIMAWTFSVALQAAAIFPAEIEAVSRERASGAYRMSAYYFSKMAGELPLTFAKPTLFCTAIYWIARLNGVRQFFIAYSIILLNIVSIQSVGFILSIVFSDRQLSEAVLHGMLHFSMLLSGFLIQDIPSWLAWAKYFSHMFYPFSALCIILYENAEPVPCNTISVIDFSKCLQNSSDYVTSVEILHAVGIELPVYCYVGTMILICVILRVVVYIALRLKRPSIS
ncbi:uncharacterized protein LOC123556707 [Mercenaria mercenaria]|uniref:uncharacterized protein LOC123556707 n=1 Tax=Mercenaria mercenaria TaxID=6596 RepID=UPI00234F97EB|nr:uncharacterized protein LOC123556707 [Mercenaria mercenaria]